MTRDEDEEITENLRRKIQRCVFDSSKPGCDCKESLLEVFASIRAQERQRTIEEAATEAEKSKKHCNCHTQRCWCGLVDEIAQAIRNLRIE